jgi:hypothetical protein
MSDKQKGAGLLWLDTRHSSLVTDAKGGGDQLKAPAFVAHGCGRHAVEEQGIAHLEFHFQDTLLFSCGLNHFAGIGHVRGDRLLG